MCNLRPQQTSRKCNVFQNEELIKTNMNLENISDSHYDWHIVTADTQQKKKPITLLNEWAQMSDGGSNKKQTNVSYTLVAITGQAHQPIFTYVCQVHDKTGI